MSKENETGIVWCNYVPLNRVPEQEFISVMSDDEREFTGFTEDNGYHIKTVMFSVGWHSSKQYLEFYKYIKKLSSYRDIHSDMPRHWFTIDDEQECRDVFGLFFPYIFFDDLDIIPDHLFKFERLD